jgi:hypothetical protein
MIEFIVQIIVVSLVTWGIYCLFSDGYMLGPLGQWLIKNLGLWFCKPLFACPPCMASVHGGIFALIVYDFTWQTIVFIMCLCGLNFIIKSILYPEYE